MPQIGENLYILLNLFLEKRCSILPYDILIGRTEADKKEFGNKGIIFLGRSYVKMERAVSLANNVFLDVNRSHVVMITGKRGSGKSYSLSVIMEGMMKLPEELAKNICPVIFDTMGIFWTMKFPNERDETLLKEWNLKPEGLDIVIFTPKGFYNKYKEEEIPTDFPFSIRPSELSAEDWYLSFGLDPNDAVAVLIEKIIYEFSEKKIIDYSTDDIIKAIHLDKETELNVKNAAKNKFRAAKAWGLFDKHGTKIADLLKPGKAVVLDVSCYSIIGGWGVKNLVIGLVAKKLFLERMKIRKEEEIETIKKGYRYVPIEEEKEKKPMIWLMLDEAHESLPDKGRTAATDSLVMVLREGRQPGVSLILATQQPGKIHRDAMTQSDVIISHRITAKPDLDALSSIMQTYLLTDIYSYINNLPRERGAAIILDDSSERIYPVKIRPKFSWHGGEAPTLIKRKRKLEIEW